MVATRGGWCTAGRVSLREVVQQGSIVKNEGR